MVNNINNTESLPSPNNFIDKISQKEALRLMIESHFEAITIVKEVLPEIEKIVDEIFSHLSKSNLGRIIYIGAGTSGRIAVQDGVELFPTFSWPKERLKYIIAGGDLALTNSIENAEDDKVEAIKQVSLIKINRYDVVIALAASSNTPFTCQAALSSKKNGALVIGIGNNKDGDLQKNSCVALTLNTGSEVLAGSTRLKAGTAQKVCLNVISTMLMTKFGRVKNGQMKYLVPSNKKLKKRKINQKI